MKSACIVLLLTLSLSSVQASLLCQSGVVTNNRISNICAVSEIPDNSVINYNYDCSTYEVAINADLHNKPNTLELTLFNEQGEERTTNAENEISWGDGNGNGVFIKCVER